MLSTGTILLFLYGTHTILLFYTVLTLSSCFYIQYWHYPPVFIRYWHYPPVFIRYWHHPPVFIRYWHYSPTFIRHWHNRPVFIRYWHYRPVFILSTGTIVLFLYSVLALSFLFYTQYWRCRPVSLYALMSFHCLVVNNPALHCPLPYSLLFTFSHSLVMIQLTQFSWVSLGGFVIVLVLLSTCFHTLLSYPHISVSISWFPWCRGGVGRWGQASCNVS